MKTSLVILGLLFAAACDDNDSSDTSGPGTGSEDDNFTAFVIATIEQHTDDVTEPIAFDVFANLPDDDANNPDAYDSLF